MQNLKIKLGVYFVPLVSFFISGCQAGETLENVTVNNNSTMIRIGGGTFMMGSPASEIGRQNDETQHQVSVSDFQLSSHELTVGEFRDFIDETKYVTYAESNGGWVQPGGGGWQQRRDANWKNPYFKQGDRNPVVLVSWIDAVNYCNWRSKKEGLTPTYTVNGLDVKWDRNANGYRLPTEAEWEYACRAGTITTFNTGDHLTTAQANFDGTSPYGNAPRGEYRKRTISTGSFEPNAWGLYDMHSNAFEWCWDRYGSYSTDEQTDPEGPNVGTNRVYRSGSWGQSAVLSRSAHRRNNTPTAVSDGLGFRIARNAE